MKYLIIISLLILPLFASAQYVIDKNEDGTVTMEVDTKAARDAAIQADIAKWTAEFNKLKKEVEKQGIDINMVRSKVINNIEILLKITGLTPDEIKERLGLKILPSERDKPE